MLIDLSLMIEPNESEPVDVKIDYVSHKEGGDILGQSIGISSNEFPDKLGLSYEQISLTSHTGTHIDAPLHYGPTCEGDPSKSIADLPVEWFYSDAVLLRFKEDYRCGEITLQEVKNQLTTINYQIKPFDIVLLQTQGDKLWGTTEYFNCFRGVSLEVTKWLIEQGVKVIGVDTFGFDAPFKVMLARYKKTRDQNVLWPAHIFGREKEYCQIERLANLSSIPVQHNFKVFCFPIKISNSGAAWTRAIASIQNNENREVNYV